MSDLQRNGTWTVVSTNSGLDGLVFGEVDTLTALGDHDCLIRIEAASLNYRDVMIPKGWYPFPLKNGGVIPGSDGAGTVIRCGNRVTRFKPGDSVCTTVSQDHLYGPPKPELFNKGTGGTIDGVFRQYGVFEDHSLVAMPSTLSFREAATLPCAAVTAWNALYGLKGRAVRAGDYVLTLGTGGVSLFAVQFAVAAGAVVIATTSSDEKMDLLKQLGARHVLNYTQNTRWGATAREFTPDQNGVDFVIEVGGSATLKQSLNAVKMDGILAITGAAGSEAVNFDSSVPTFLDAWLSTCIVRGIFVGSRAQFEDMNRVIDAANIKPYINPKSFALDALKDAYQYLLDRKHIGKVVIECQRLKAS